MAGQDTWLTDPYSIKMAFEDGKLTLGPLEQRMALALLVEEISKYTYKPTRWQKIKKWLAILFR